MATLTQLSLPLNHLIELLHKPSEDYHDIEVSGEYHSWYEPSCGQSSGEWYYLQFTLPDGTYCQVGQLPSLGYDCNPQRVSDDLIEALEESE